MGHSKHKKHHRHRSKNKSDDDGDSDEKYRRRDRRRSPTTSSSDQNSTASEDEEYREKKISTKGKTMEQIEEERQVMKADKKYVKDFFSSEIFLNLYIYIYLDESVKQEKYMKHHMKNVNVV